MVAGLTEGGRPLQGTVDAAKVDRASISNVLSNAVKQIGDIEVTLARLQNLIDGPIPSSDAEAEAEPIGVYSLADNINGRLYDIHNRLSKLTDAL